VADPGFCGWERASASAWRARLYRGVIARSAALVMIHGGQLPDPPMPGYTSDPESVHEKYLNDNVQFICTWVCNVNSQYNM
jgi:hypothetical protein